MNPVPFISSTDLITLLPLISLATGTVVVMLIAAFARRHGTVAQFTGIVLIITLCSLAYAGKEIPRTVTPLLQIDALALFTIALLTLASLAITLIAYPYFQARTLHREEFYPLLLLALLGAAALASANHFAALLLGLETLGVALFCLASYNTRSQSAGAKSLEAGIKYLVLSGIASALLLFGMALIYAQCGQLAFDAITLPPAVSAPAVDIVLFYGGSALMLAGLCFKLSPVSAVIASLSKSAVFVVLLRYVIASDSLQSPQLFGLLVIIAGLSMLVGNWLALMQDNIKRLLAYSSIAHLGYLLVAFLALQGSLEHNSGLAVEACSIYLAAYVITTTGAFAIVSLQSSRSEQEVEHIRDYNGLFWRRPLTALAFTFMLLSLAGIPLTAGFIGKFYLFSAGTQAGLWSLLAILIAGSGIGLFYYLRLITALYKKVAPGSENLDADSGTTLSPAYIAVAVLALVLLLVGVYPQPLMEQAQRVAETLQIKGHMASK
ncbi:MAG: NADH-quinone oxidoreductase subunit N [Exilibacterium sp.]